MAQEVNNRREIRLVELLVEHSQKLEMVEECKHRSYKGTEKNVSSQKFGMKQGFSNLSKVRI
jgi:uncharacterized protein YlaI